MSLIKKGFIKQPFIKQSPAYQICDFLIDCSFEIKAFVSFEAMMRFHWQAFTVYKH